MDSTSAPKLERNFVGENLSDMSITISGLDAGTYNVSTWHYDWFIAHNVNLFDIVVSDAIGSDRLLVDDYDHPPNGVLSTPLTYVVGSNGTADITIDIVYVSGLDGPRFSGIQIASIPEPSRALLLTCGLFTLLLRRRKE